MLITILTHRARFYVYNNSIYYDYNKNGKSKIYRYFWNEQFCFLTFFCTSQSLSEKLNFWFLITFFTIKTKTVLLSKICQNENCRFLWDEKFYLLIFFRILHCLAGTVGQKWLANELDLHFLTLKECTKGQSNRQLFQKLSW